MNRRAFFGALGAGAAGFVIDPERLLWRPGAKTFFLPPLRNTATFKLSPFAAYPADYYVGFTLLIQDGAGAWQHRTITEYDGDSRLATVDWPWRSNPRDVTRFGIIGPGSDRKVAIKLLDVDHID